MTEKYTLKTGQEIEFYPNDLDINGIGTIMLDDLIGKMVTGLSEDDGEEITGKIYMIRRVIDSDGKFVAVLDIISSNSLASHYDNHNLNHISKSLVAETCRLVDDTGLSIFQLKEQ
jgi:sugar lactone lactonase YvrE